MFILPLHNFRLTSEKEYVFKCGRYKIRRLNPEYDVLKDYLFSEQDIDNIRFTKWIIESSEVNIEILSEEINLILMSMKLFFRISPYVKYKICKENILECERMTEFQCSTKTESYKDIEYSDLCVIDDAFERLKEMQHISNRTFNALYFLYRGFYSVQWRDSFIFLVTVLESLFSKNSPGGITKTICNRVTKFINSKEFTFDRVEKIYNIRSDIVHGRITLDPRSENNIEKISELEELVTQVMQKILNEKTYMKFDTNENRNKYLEML